MYTHLSVTWLVDVGCAYTSWLCHTNTHIWYPHGCPPRQRWTTNNEATKQQQRMQEREGKYKAQNTWRVLGNWYVFFCFFIWLHLLFRGIIPTAMGVMGTASHNHHGNHHRNHDNTIGCMTMTWPPTQQWAQMICLGTLVSFFKIILLYLITTNKTFVFRYYDNCPDTRPPG